MDYSAKNNVPENPSAAHGEPKLEKRAEERNSREVREAADVGKAAYVEAMGLDEGLETTGKVSEVLGKTAENDVVGALGAKQGAGSIDPALIRKKLLEGIPSAPQMRKHIQTEIEKDINYLHKTALKMLHTPGNMSYFEMANLMRKIRELKAILVQLVKASVDTLKTLWLRFVHGIM